jgi:2-hydroxychromene-2-carboxylate isomerase
MTFVRLEDAPRRRVNAHDPAAHAGSLGRTVTQPAALYFDLMSPYAYLAVERASRVLAQPPRLEPVLLGAIFQQRGSGSWAQTPIRDLRLAEIAARARHYGLPPFVVPPGWPGNSLPTMRAAIWAQQHGRVEEFARAVYHAAFVEGQDPGDVGMLAACAANAGLKAGALVDAIATPEVKDELRRRTAAAWEAGVRGVPTLIAAGVIYYGDDQLELAAAAGA